MSSFFQNFKIVQMNNMNMYFLIESEVVSLKLISSSPWTDIVTVALILTQPSVTTNFDNTVFDIGHADFATTTHIYE